MKRSSHFWLNKNGVFTQPERDHQHQVEVHHIYMMAVSESSLGRWYSGVTFDTELLSHHEEDGHHLEEETSLAVNSPQMATSYFSQHASISFSAPSLELQNYAHAHAFTGVQSEAQSTVVLRYHSRCTIIAQYWFFSYYCPAFSLRSSYNFPRDPRYLPCNIIVCNPRAKNNNNIIIIIIVWTKKLTSR